ncbi:helix-turn-helix transcriptional regulator, partial [Halalkalibaculum sp. DA384]|uniref:S24 family peptidase n=1 Tax=Halalkalibaculum sp. DA384 TaxID=3373606 RepID=UPI00375468D1
MFLNKILHTQSDHLFALQVNCDSMNPEIKAGSIVLVNQNENSPTGDGIFAVRLGNLVQLKILQPLPNSWLHLTTINKKYDPIEINPDETQEFEILGRVIW